MADNLGSVGTAFVEIVADFSKFESSLNGSQLKSAAESAAQSVSGIGDAAEQTATKATSSFDRMRSSLTAFNEARESAMKNMGAWTDFADTLDSVGSKAQSLGFGLTAAVTAPILAVTGLGLSFNAMQESAQIGFTTMLGSGQQAKSFLEGLKDFAARTPFEFPDLVRASQRMLAYGFAAKDIIPTLTAVGDASSMLGGRPETIERITLALGQIKAKGTVQAEEMRQLAEAGIPAWDILANKLGVTIPQAMKLVENRAVSADVAIKALTEGMEQRFGGGMEKAAHSMTGLLSTVADEFRFISGSLTEGLFNALKGPLETLTAGMTAFRKELELVPDGFKAVGLAGGLAIASIGPALWVGGSLAGGIANLIKLSVELKGVWAGMTAPGGIMPGATIGGTVGDVLKVGGIVALGVAAGIAAGKLINLAIAASGKQDWFDKQLAAGLNFGPLGWMGGKLLTGQSQVDEANDSTKVGVARMKMALQASGLPFDQGSMSDADFIARSAALMRDNQISVGPRNPGPGATTPPKDPFSEAERKHINDMVEAIDGENKKYRELTEVLRIAEAQHKSVDAVTKVYGDDIVKMVEQMKAAGTTVSKNNEKWYEAVKSQQALDNAIMSASKWHVPINGLASDFQGLEMKIAGAQDKAQQLFSLLATPPPMNIGESLEQLIPQRAIDDAIRKANQGPFAGNEMEQLRDKINGFPRPADVLLQDPGETIGRGIDRSNRAVQQQIDKMKESAKESEQWRTAWSTAMGNITTDFAKGFTDMLFNAKSFSGVLKGTFTELGKSLTETMLVHFFHPVQKEFEKLAAKITDTLSDKVFSKIFGGSKDDGGIDTFGRVIGPVNSAGKAPSAPSGGSGGGGGGGGGNLLSNIFAGGTMVSSIIGNFQQARLEGTMNAVEANTRFTYIELRDTMDIYWTQYKALLEIQGNTAILANNVRGGGGGVGTAAMPPITVELHEEINVYTGAGDPATILSVVRQGVDTNREGFLEDLATKVWNARPGLPSATPA